MREYPVGLFLDLSRAFDYIDHDLLNQKLSCYGFRGAAGSWFASYLKDRQQMVKIRNVSNPNNQEYFSQPLFVNSGVPQGSVLGPVLFLLFINDLHTNVDAPLVLYADDTSCIVSEKTSQGVQLRCNSILRQLTDWFLQNKLVLNERKTVYTRYRNTHCRQDLTISLVAKTHQLEHSDSFKLLGIKLDKLLNWGQHCDMLSGEINKLSYQMRILRTYLTIPQLKQFYFACVHSKVRYGICLWGASAASQAVFVAQKRVVRTLLGASTVAPSRPLFRSLNIMPLPCLYLYEISLYVFSNRNKFVLVHDVHNYPTRGSGNIYVRCAKLNVTNKSPTHLGALVFNKLPERIKSATSVRVFKKLLHTYMLERMFYTVGEFFES